MSDTTHNRVLEAAGPIFADKGFEGATVREICAGAGVNLASVNYHFGHKEALYLEVVRLAQRLKMEKVPSATWPEATPPEKKLGLFVKAMLTRLLATSALDWETRLLMREMIQPTIACQSIVEDFIRPQLDLLLGILDELLPESVELHRRHQIAFSIVGQCIHYRVAREFVALLISDDERKNEYTIDKLAEHITAFSLSALKSLSEGQPR